MLQEIVLLTRNISQQAQRTEWERKLTEARYASTNTYDALKNLWRLQNLLNDDRLKGEPMVDDLDGEIELAGPVTTPDDDSGSQTDF